MEAAAKRLLELFRTNLVYLKDNLQYTQIRIYIRQYGIVQGDVQETINALPTRGEQIEYLLSDVLPRRPPKGVVLFAKALIETDQGHHLEKIGVSKQDMEYIRGISKDQTSQAVQGNITHVSGEVKPLWDPLHPDGQAFIDRSELGNKLTDAAPKLKRIVLTADLWANLQSHRVMEYEDVDRCKKKDDGATADQVGAIIDFLQSKQVWKVHAFFRCLAQTRQEGVIDVVLGPNGKKPYIQNLD